MPAEKLITPLLKSNLEEVIFNLDDAFTMKGASVHNYLLKQSQKFNTPIKAEELEKSGVLRDIQMAPTVTKADLLLRLKEREDVFKTTVLGSDTAQYRETTLPELNFTNYHETIRRHSQLSGIPQTRPTHFQSEDIKDTLWHVRKTDGHLTDPVTGDIGDRGRIIFEIQSDPIQAINMVGRDLNEAHKLADKFYKEGQEFTKKAAEANAEWKAALTDLQNLDPESKEWEIAKQRATKAKANASYWDARATSKNNAFSGASNNYEHILKNVNRDLYNDISEWHQEGSVDMQHAAQFFKDLNFPQDETAYYANKVVTAYEDAAMLLGGDEQTIGLTLGNTSLQNDLTDILDEAFGTTLPPYSKGSSLRNQIAEDNRKGIGGIYNKVDNTMPFQHNWVEKAIDEEILEAFSDDLRFIAIPLETGSDALKRSGWVSPEVREIAPELETWGVQKWYETTVRNTLQKKVETLNRQITREFPNAQPDELFKYDEVKVPVKHPTAKLVGTDTRTRDIADLSNSLSTTDIEMINTEMQLFTPDDIQHRMNIQRQNGAPVLENVARRELFQEALQDEPIERINAVLDSMYNLSDPEVHIMGKISLPKKPIMTEAFARSDANPDNVYFDYGSLAKFIDTAGPDTFDEMVNLAPSLQKASNFRMAHALTKAGATGDEGVYQATIDNYRRGAVEDIQDLPIKEQRALATMFGINRQSLSRYRQQLPQWAETLSLYAGAMVPMKGMRVEEGGIVHWEKPATGIPIPVIAEALKAPEANKIKVVDYLKSMGYEEAMATNVVDKLMTQNVAKALAAGHTPNDITDHLLAKGYSPEDVDKYLPNETVLEDVYDFNMNVLKSMKTAGEDLYSMFAFIPLGGFQEPIERTIARTVAANETVDSVVNNLGAPFSRTFAVKAQMELNALNTDIIRALQQNGYNPFRDEDGNIFVLDSNGQPVPVESGFFELMMARRDELIGGLLLAAQGARIGAPRGLLGAAIGGAIGGGIGAGLGRGTDILRNKIILKEELEAKFIMDEMYKTGAADSVFGALGSSALWLGAKTWKGLYRAYDWAVKGNTEGAARALREYMHITPEQADQMVTDWTNLNQKELKGTKAEQQLAILPRMAAPQVTGAASKQSSAGSVNVAREISQRAQDIKDKVASLTHENFSPILFEELRDYELKVANHYDSVKAFATEQMRGSNYQFDYEKLVIEPLLDKAVKGLENPAIRKQATRLFNQIKNIGNGAELDSVTGREVYNPRRTFSELLELRELVREFGTKRTIVKPKDKEMVEKMLANIDKEIRHAARTHLDGADAWLELWGPAKQGHDNLADVRKNVLYKAITKVGATNKTIQKALTDKAEAIDETFRDIIQALPESKRAPTEGAVLQSLIEKYTIGDEGGKQAIDFIALDKALKHVPFATPENRKMKQALGELARVYRSDPHILAGSGTVKLDAFRSYLTDDPAIRLKYEFVSRMFNYVKRLAPTDGGRKIAMVMATAKALEKPHDSAAVKQLLKTLPPDPQLRNQLQAQLLEIAAWNEKSNFPRVPVYSSQPKGYSIAPEKGPLGTGRYYYVDKTKARIKSRSQGRKLEEKLILPDRIADDTDIRMVLSLPDDFEITPDFIKKQKNLKELLEGRGFSGIIVDDTVMLY